MTAGPDPQCVFDGALERIALVTDLATMTGTLERISPGKNHYRKIKVRLVADTPAS